MKKSVVACVLMVCLLLTGCGASQEEQQVIDEMSSDYGETFTYVRSAGDGFLVKSSVLDADVYVEMTDDGFYRTNYLSVQYEDETHDYIAASLSQFYEKSYVDFTAPEQALDEDVPHDASFETYLSDSGVDLTGILEVGKSSYLDPSAVDRLVGALSMYGTDFSFDFVVLPDDVVGTLSEKELQKKMSSGDVEAYAVLSNDDGMIQIDWKIE